MQKKIVAAICAAALALAMPAAAFAGSATTGETGVVAGPNGSQRTYTLEKSVDGENADVTAFSMTVNPDYARGAVIKTTDAVASNYTAYTNDLLTQSFQINAKDGLEGANWTGACDVDMTVKFDAKKWNNFPTTVDTSNLWTRVYIQHDLANGVESRGPVNDTEISWHMDACSVVTAVLSNGPLSYGQPVGANNVKDLADSANNGKSPKTGEIAA